MISTIRVAIDYLNELQSTFESQDRGCWHIRHSPEDVVRFLRTDIDLISSGGRLQEKKYVLADLQIAADCLSHPSIDSMGSRQIAKSLCEIISHLK